MLCVLANVVSNPRTIIVLIVFNPTPIVTIVVCMFYGPRLSSAYEEWSGGWSEVPLFDRGTPDVWGESWEEEKVGKGE